MAQHNRGGLSIGLVFDDSLDSSDGVAQYVKTLGGWLADRGHQVTYLVGQSTTRTWAGGDVFSCARNLKIKWAGNNLSMPILPDLPEIKRLIRDKKFDVLHVQVPYSPLMAQAVIKKADFTTAVIGTFHVFPGNSSSRLGARVLRRVYGRSLRRFDEIVSVSTAAADFAQTGFGISGPVLPNVIDISRFKSGGVRTKKAQRIVFLGRLVKRKGCLELLEAFRLLRGSLPKAELVIAGDGPLRDSLQGYVRRHHLGDRVSFLGFIKESQKAGLLASADVACFPSLYGESFGIVLIEAMASGAKTVLGGDNAGYRSVLKDQPKLLIDPTKPADFAERLRWLLSDEVEVKELTSWQARTVEQYDIRIIGPKLIEIYHQQIARRTKKSNN